MKQDPIKKKVQVWVLSHDLPRQVLILKTLPSRGAFWQPVTGGVEVGESLRDAALREAGEETGFKSYERFEELGFEFSFERDGSPITECVWYGILASEASDQPTLDTREHNDWRWVAPMEAKTLLKHLSNRQALDILIDRKLV